MQGSLKSDFCKVYRSYILLYIEVCHLLYIAAFAACEVGHITYSFPNYTSLHLPVASNVSLVEDGERCSLKELPLPKFLDRLRQSSAGLSEEQLPGQEQLLERCCQLYALARYEDGVSWAWYLGG